MCFKTFKRNNTDGNIAASGCDRLPGDRVQRREQEDTAFRDQNLVICVFDVPKYHSRVMPTAIGVSGDQRVRAAYNRSCLCQISSQNMSIPRRDVTCRPTSRMGAFTGQPHEQGGRGDGEPHFVVGIFTPGMSSASAHCVNQKSDTVSQK